MHLFPLTASACCLVTLAFATLKLCHVIAMDWWWVASPLWGGAIAALLLVLYVLWRVAAAARAGRNPFE